MSPLVCLSHAIQLNKTYLLSREWARCQAGFENPCSIFYLLWFTRPQNNPPTCIHITRQFTELTLIMVSQS